MQIISVVALGVYRHVAASTDFQGGPYRIAAILDLTSEPPAFNYNPHNLGAVLHSLHPRPQVFVTGAAITPAMTNESIEIWEKYVKALGVEDTLVINVRVRGAEGWNHTHSAGCSCKEIPQRTVTGGLRSCGGWMGNIERLKRSFDRRSIDNRRYLGSCESFWKQVPGLGVYLVT